MDALFALDAVVVATPVDDARLYGLRLQVLGEGFAEERREFVVGGEAEGDELFDREFVDVRAVFNGQESVEAKTLFEADDTVLDCERAVAAAAGNEEQDNGHDDPPEEKSPMLRPVMDGYVDGEDEVEQEDRQNKEVKGRIEARVVLEVLRSGH